FPAYPAPRSIRSRSSVFSFGRLAFITPVLQLAQQFVEPLVAFLPGMAVLLDPLRHVLQRGRLEAARTPLRLAALADEACPLKHLQVLRHSGQLEVERSRQLQDRRLARLQPGQNRPPGRV